MASNPHLKAQIVVALSSLRTARTDGDPHLAAIAETRLNELLDQLALVPA